MASSIPSTDDSSSICLGIIADIQYRDTDDMYVEKHGFTRSYRAALPKTVSAVASFSARSVDACLHLGDIIDGRGSDLPAAEYAPIVRDELDAVVNALSLLPSSTRLFHVVGNHCLYVGREVLEDRLRLSVPFYATDLSRHWRLVVLDTVHVSVDRPQGDARRAEADAYLLAHEGEPNAVPWNGTLGATQTTWLRKELEAARTRGLRVLVSGHHPVVVEAAGPEHLMWAAGEVQNIFAEYRDVVACYFAGHYHSGGRALLDGVEHVTFPAVLDSDETNAFAFVTLSRDRIDIEGVGKKSVASCSISLK